jgi:hypothetical protein
MMKSGPSKPGPTKHGPSKSGPSKMRGRRGRADTYCMITRSAVLRSGLQKIRSRWKRGLTLDELTCLLWYCYRTTKFVGTLDWLRNSLARSTVTAELMNHLQGGRTISHPYKPYENPPFITICTLWLSPQSAE